MDLDGQRWVSAYQVGQALGTQEIRRLIHELEKQGELEDGKHLRSVTELNPQGPGNPRRIILSWRGVIRVAMRSQGERARHFRDRAEEVALPGHEEGLLRLTRVHHQGQAGEF